MTWGRQGARGCGMLRFYARMECPLLGRQECCKREDERMGLNAEERQRHLPAGRKAQLAAHVAEAGQVTVSALAERFGVSIDTIRRDLDQLSSEGVLVRTYGGAVSRSALPRVDRAVDVRLSLQEGEKDKIAALAASLVEDGSTVMINGG